MDSKIYRQRREIAEEVSLPDQIEEISKEFINNLGRVADFFGFNRLMGQLYAVLFLSPEPLTLDDMVKKLESSKGNVSINIRALERWGLVRQIYKWADRKNYYEAEPDVWKAVSGILQERERKESQQIISSLNQSVERLEQASKTASGQEAVTAQFYMERMEVLRRLFKFGDSLLDMMVQGGAVDFGSASRLARSTDEYKEGISDLDELALQQLESDQESHGARN
ncbi:MAG: putative Transcriptional regulator protein-like protein [Chloroflexi bacterium]|jgi:DNA-binding transcriptional regulator GbsR (MarR family)|nr:putative Transcriptional regulator protein-like protein [Chloroflexota bacterium]